MTTVITLLALSALAVLAGRSFQMQQDLNKMLIAHDAMERDLTDLEEHVASMQLAMNPEAYDRKVGAHRA